MRKKCPKRTDPLTTSERKLVEKNIRLVYRIANNHARNKGMQKIHVDDLIQHGSLGLMRAAQKFDPSRGHRFSTCATMWINSYMQDHFRDRVVRKPKNHDPIIVFSLDCHDYTATMMAKKSGADNLTVRDQSEPIQAAIEVGRIMEELNPREKVIIEGFMDGRTSVSISHELGLCPERVRQIRESAFDRIKENLTHIDVSAAGRKFLDAPCASSMVS